MRTKYSILYFFAVILMLGGALSCSDFLTEDPRGQMAVPNFFKNEKDLDAALTALHLLICEQNDANNVVGTEALWGDDVSTHPASNKLNLREYDQFNVTETNACGKRGTKSSREPTLSSATLQIARMLQRKRSRRLLPLLLIGGLSTISTW